MRAKLSKLLLLSLGAAFLATRSRSADAPATAPAAFLAGACARADGELARPDLAAYRGWIKYLRGDATRAAARSGAADEAAVAKARRLDEWAARIAANPGLLGTLAGVQEWAYESPVDDSGQPFRIAIPVDYDPAHPAPLTVYMHGYSGNHIEHSAGMHAHPGSFDIAVLGRSRGGGYRALSEADVLQAIDYVVAHWAIDPDRISLNGGSMGGGGTYRLGSRYPQRWCSGRPTCGYASFLPMGNLVTLPIYATHSADDPTVSVLNDRGPLAVLRGLGGRVIYDETNGYGHAVWNYKEGNERGAAWEKLQVRPDSRTVRRVDYTALDGGAVRGWWGEVAEWGGAPGPARFVLTAGDANTLYAEVTNIARLRLRLAESPFDRARPLNVSVNGALPFTLPAPLPESAVLALGERGWGPDSEPPPPFRLHTPGSAVLLYGGEPLLIVYGTRGGEAERAAMRAAALAASKSPSPAWPKDGGEAGTDGVPHSQNLYGWLNTKADVDVSDADIARCHLVLIGTAAQNAVVGRIAAALPVRLEDTGVACSDGTRFAGGALALGLVYYNPLAQGRLIFWVASDTTAAYAAGSAIPSFMAVGALHTANAFGADLLVMASDSPTLVAARGFDSRWRWLAGREASPLLPASLAATPDFSRAVGRAISRAAAADFCLVGSYGAPASPPFSAGVTRVCDVEPFFAEVPVGVFDVDGRGLLKLADSAGAKDSGFMVSGLDAGKIEAGRAYRVALPVNLLPTLSAVLQPPPASYRLAGVDAGEAVGRFLR